MLVQLHWSINLGDRNGRGECDQTDSLSCFQNYPSFFWGSISLLFFGGLSASWSCGGLSAPWSFGGLSASDSVPSYFTIPIKVFKNSRRTLVRAFVPMSATIDSPATCWIDHSPAATDWGAYADLSLKWRVRQLPPSLMRMASAERLSVFTTLETVSNSSARIT